jgi:hypothetical protein
MTTARCPLVRAIEEAAASCPHGPGTHPTAAQVDAYFIVVDNVFYDRIRAALEAAEEMAEWMSDPGCEHGNVAECRPCAILARYRAATRKQ